MPCSTWNTGQPGSGLSASIERPVRICCERSESSRLEALLGSFIELRRGIVDQDGALATRAVLEQTDLGQDKRRGHELLLATRCRFAHASRLEFQAQIGPMRTDLCKSHGSILLARCLEGLSEIRSPPPSRPILEVYLVSDQRLRLLGDNCCQ